MSQYKELRKPLLTKKDEEYQMLAEVAEEYIHQKGEKASQKNGTAPEVIIREHLLRRGFNVTFNPNIKITGSNIKNALFLLQPTIYPEQKEYSPNEVNTVILVKNNAVANQSKIIKEEFDELKQLSPQLRFAVVILSERLGYAHEVTDEKLGDKSYLSFTLVSRRINPKIDGLYCEKALSDLLKNKDMKKTGDWDRFIAYLKQV